MQKSSDFKLHKNIMFFNSYNRKYVANEIPSIHRDLRIHLLDEDYNLLKYMFLALHNKGNIRAKYINELVVTISLIDSLLSFILEACPQNRKHIIKSIELLTNIKNLTYGWHKNPEPLKEDTVEQ